jgi:hypothetical protein
VDLFFYRAIDLIAYNLNIGMAIHLAAGGYYPIGRALGLRLKTVCCLMLQIGWSGMVCTVTRCVRSGTMRFARAALPAGIAELA